MSLFTYLKQQLPILEVIAEFVLLKPAGNYWKGPCPFHAEKDASFTVSPEKQIFYCFGCHASGDVIAFIAKTENMTQVEAAHHLIESYKITIPAHLKQTQQIVSVQAIEEKDRYFRICNAVSKWAHAYLLTQKAPQQYLVNRQLNEQSVKLFMVGYLPSGAALSNLFIKGMIQQGILLKELIQHGIITEGNTNLSSPFEERILFPIKDALGRFCGFGGRCFKQGDKRPKYYNSKETIGFEKGKLLFGLDIAKKALQDQGIGFLVEGYMDCIMMVQAGYTNTIATLGTACTLEHLKLLSRYIHTLMVLYDGDQAGQKAMLRLTELCWEVNLDLKIVILPAGHDPASFLGQGESLTPLIAQACDIITFFINSTGTGFASKPLSQKINIAEKIASIIAKVNNPFKQDLLLHHTAAITQLPFASLKDLMRSSTRKIIKNTTLAENSKSIDINQESVHLSEIIEISLLEEKIFSVIISNIQAPLIHKVPKDIYACFSVAGRHLIEKLEIFMQKNDPQNRHMLVFLDMLSQAYKQLVMRISMKYAHSNQDSKENLDILLVRFYKFHWQNIAKNIKDEIVRAKKEQNESKVHELLERFAQLKKEILTQSRGLI